MKKILLTMAAVGLATSIYAQGTVAFQNFLGAAGLVQIDGVTAPVGTQVTVQLLYGAPGTTDVGSMDALTPAFTTTLAQAGKFYNATTATLTGITAGSGSTDSAMNVALAVQGWEGAYATWAEAETAGVKMGQTMAFDNPTGGGGQPPAVAANMVGWLADNPLNLTTAIIPEPTTFALLGLGALGMMIFRRK